MSTTRIYLNDTLHVMGNVVSQYKRTYHTRKFVQPETRVVQKQLSLFVWVTLWNMLGQVPSPKWRQQFYMYLKKNVETSERLCS